MIDPAEANETYRAASAIAAFDAIQVAFAALVKKGILSKAEAEQILRDAIETTGGAGDQTAELLAIALERISKFFMEALDVSAFAPDIGRTRWRLLGRQRSVSGTV